VEQAKERQRDTRSLAWLAGWSMDVKLGARMLAKTPGVTAIAVVALAVGIGAGASYIEFVSGVFRGKLPFPGGERVVGLLNWNVAKSDVEDRSLYEFVTWKDQLTTVEELGATREMEETISAEDGTFHTAQGSEISATAFRVAATAPLLGRPLLAGDENPGSEPVVVIGEDLWRTRFQADPRLIGRPIRFGETVRTVVGVMPFSFGFPVSSSFWVPLRLEAAAIRPGEGPKVRLFGRLAPGADVVRAQAELETVARRTGGSREGAPAGMQVSVHPFVESFWADFARSRSGVNPVFAILYSFNFFFVALLGICAANVALLVFARTASREGEITVRTALGASRARIVAQLVAEALVLAAIAGAAGLMGASATLGKLRSLWGAATESRLPFWWDERIGIETVVYSALLAVLAALLIGAVPALKATGAGMQGRLKAVGDGGATMRFGRLWTGIMVAQVGVTVMMLVVLISSGWAAYTQGRRAGDVRFARNEYLFAGVRFENGATPERARSARRELLRRLGATAGVINATFATHLPGEDEGEEFIPELAPAGRSSVTVRLQFASTNYFETFQQPLIAGRLFTGAEIEEGRNVAIVDETFARTVLGGRSAVGQQVRQARRGAEPEGPWLEVVGVVRDVAPGVAKTFTDAKLYRPAPEDGSIFVHSRDRDAAAKLRAAATATDAGLQLVRLTTIERHAANDAKLAGIGLSVLGAIAAVTLLLAAAGIHSLISFTLTSRTREIGIRTALGAAPSRIVRSLLSPAFLKVGAGIVLGGVPGTVLVSGPMQLGMTSAVTAVVAGGVAGFILAVTAFASIWPVRRALRIQPTEALRTT